MPAWFHVFVLPWCNWMPACLESASVNTSWRRCLRDGQIDVVEANNCCPGSSERATSSNALCIPREQEWHQRVPLLASLSLRHCPTLSVLVKPTVRRWLCVGEAHERQHLAGTGHLQPAEHCRPKNVVVNANAVHAQNWQLGININGCPACAPLSSTGPIETARTLLREHPVAIPLTPPSGFVSAVSLAPIRTDATSSGTFACAREEHAPNNNSVMSLSSRRVFKCSCVHRPGPGEEPRGALLRLVRNVEDHWSLWFKLQHFL